MKENIQNITSTPHILEPPLSSHTFYLEPQRSKSTYIVTKEVSWDQYYAVHHIRIGDLHGSQLSRRSNSFYEREIITKLAHEQYDIGYVGQSE